MGWFKRNLFFAIGLLVALLLLGASGFYIWKESSRNAEKLNQLNEIYGQLQNVKAGTDKSENLEAARTQTEQIRQWVRGTKDYFVPIERLPSGQLTDASFGTMMKQTIAQLQREAEAGNVSLPPTYNFSFQAQSDKVRFAPGSLDKLSVQLGEVKTIVEMLFGAHVNALEGIQRLRISEDDTSSTAGDYIDEPVATTELGTLTPYQVTFRGFSSEIAQVLQAFATSSHGFVIKTITVQPANATTGSTDTGTPPPMPATTVARGPQTLLTEQMLRVTMMIEVAKLTSGR